MWPTPASLTLRRASCGTSGCTSLLIFPAPFSFPLKRASLLTAINFWEQVSSTRAFYLMLLLIAFMLSLFQRRESMEDRASKQSLLPALHPNSPPLFFPTRCQGRQIARPFFTKERISDFHIFDQTSAKALNLIANRAVAYAPIDVQDLLQRFTLDAAALFLWGHALNTLDLPLTQPGRVVLGPKGSAPADGGSEWDMFTNAFETVAVLITRRGVQGDTWPLLELLKDKTEEPIQVIMDWLEPLVREALDRKSKRMEASWGDAKVSSRNEETVFLDYLADQTDGAHTLFSSSPRGGWSLSHVLHADVEHIRYEIITFLIASRDTVSAQKFDRSQALRDL